MMFPSFVEHRTQMRSWTWIEALNNHFECKETPNNKRVMVAKYKIKGASFTWWNCLQGDRVKEGRSMITSWDRMATKIKAHFVPVDYEVQIYRKMQSLRQKYLDVSAYIEEFHKMSLRTKYHEEEPDRVARYLNGLNYSIQDEISILVLDTVSKFYQLAL